ncbi:PDR/VanB family oxidoreductase [Streptomyces collinus]|uniref:Vanillate O-demethylase ferredoxin subunit n=1 Tax=Streptomyces collinus TaxID=42684 RepID=A0AA89QBV4_STRCU|nr:PDR/VanB family oxidoreductase [Streptomyces collinus]MBB5815663.1 vanillate O-demethylase ferredoxin subunit [Streptomyces collinus]WMX68555.1 PDR/VanB family oxidoreductase [Streptomyces collinus]
MTSTAGRAVVVTRIELVPDIVELVLHPARAVRPVPPGSHIDITVPLPGGPEPRSYSLVDQGHDDGLLRIAVRLQQDGGGGSRWMHDLRPGSEITFAGPIDEFPLSPGRLPSVLLAGGIGITPIVGLAHALRTRGADYRLVYAGRSRDRMAFAGDLEREHPGRITVVEDGHGTFVDPDEVVASVPEGGVLYVCGPIGLLTAVRAAWERAARPPGALRFETFGTSGAVPAEAFRVEVPARGLSFDVPVGTSLLDALEAAGVEMMYDCRRGECGLCRVVILDVAGTVDHRDVFLSERQREEGRAMCTCVSRVAGASLTIDC